MVTSADINKKVEWMGPFRETVTGILKGVSADGRRAYVSYFKFKKGKHGNKTHPELLTLMANEVTAIGSVPGEWDT